MHFVFRLKLTDDSIYIGTSKNLNQTLKSLMTIWRKDDKDLNITTIEIIGHYQSSKEALAVKNVIVDDIGIDTLRNKKLTLENIKGIPSVLNKNELLSTPEEIIETIGSVRNSVSI